MGGGKPPVAALMGSPKRPLIGVTGPDRGGLAAWLFTWLALRRAGARALRITPSRAEPLMRKRASRSAGQDAGQPRGKGLWSDAAEGSMIQRLDALVVGGGADVDPSLYGENPVSPPLGELRRRSRSLPTFLLTLLLFPLIWVLRRLLSTKQMQRGDAARDAMEARLIEQALARDLPVLGICRGAQLLNVVCGGTLHQHLDDFYDEKPNLSTIWPQKEVVITEGSRLAGVLGQNRCQVNSLHKQAIKRPGHGLREVARENNHVTQAIEHGQRGYVLGVQWHPEYLPQRREQQALFRALVDSAAGVTTAPAH